MFFLRNIEGGLFRREEAPESGQEQGRKWIEFGATVAAGAAIGIIAVGIVAEAIKLAGRQMEEVPKGAIKSIE